MSPLVPPKSVTFTRLQTMWLLRRLRADRDEMNENLMAIEERIKAGENGSLSNGHIAISADCKIAQEIITMLWRSLM